MTYEIYQSKSDKQWRWKLVGGNGERMAQGEPHPTAKLAREAVKRIKRSFLARVVVL